MTVEIFEKDGGSWLTDGEYAATKDRIMQAFHRWIPRLRLQAWRFYFDWERGAGEGRCHDTSRVAMSCNPSWRYLRLQVTVYVGTLHDADDAELDCAVVHELVHAHLDELALDDETGNWQAHNERVCESMARAYVDSYRAGLEDRDGGEAALPTEAVGASEHADAAGRGGEQPAGAGHDGAGARPARPHRPGVSHLPGVAATSRVSIRPTLSAGKLRDAVRDLSELRQPDQEHAPAR